MFGAHLSIAGGMHNALLKAEALQCDTLQVFTKNQQQWKCSPLTAECIKEWKAHATRLGFEKTVSHDSYLINLAATNSEFWRKSVELFIEELTRCQQLGIPYLVTHPGAHMGEGDEAGIRRVVAALDVIHDHVPHSPRTAGGDVVTCLEVTAGQGSCLGCKLEHLADIIARVKSPQRLGVCLDTAHLFAAGYDFRGPKKYAAFRKELAATVGIKSVKVIHMNDSKKNLGSRVDRHAHIGQGFIGLDGFKAFVRDSAWKNVPKIIETPKEGKAPDGREWDAVNLETLRSLAD
jgi:deoxyribonuclease IV